MTVNFSRDRAAEFSTQDRLWDKTSPQPARDETKTPKDDKKKACAKEPDPAMREACYQWKPKPQAPRAAEPATPASQQQEPIRTIDCRKPQSDSIDAMACDLFKIASSAAELWKILTKIGPQR